MRLELGRSVRVALASVVVMALSVARPVGARTTSFSATDARIEYIPADAWQQRGDNMTASAIAAFRVKFAGEQITLWGTSHARTGSDSRFNVTLDRASATLSSNSEDKLFIASNLDPEREHVLELEIETATMFTLTRVAVAVSSTNERVPALLPLDATHASDPSSPVVYPASTSSGSARLGPNTSSSSSGSNNSSAPNRTIGGVVAGATLGALAAFSLSVFLAAYLWRRHLRRRRSNGSGRLPLDDDDTSSVNHDMASRRRGSAFATTTRRASSVLAVPWNLARRTPCSPPPPPPDVVLDSPLPGLGNSPVQPVGGCIPISNRGGGPAVVVVGSDTWHAKLARAASWRRKAERLAETRKFYGVQAVRGGAAAAVEDLKGPPPAVPLPRLPGGRVGDCGNGETRDMEERWRSAEPTVNVVVAATARANPRFAAAAFAPEQAPGSTPSSASAGSRDAPVETTSSTKHGVGRTRASANGGWIEQAYGHAISTDRRYDTDADAFSVQVASPTSTIYPRRLSQHHQEQRQHLRRRSGKHCAKPEPLSPTSTYRNPFSHVRDDQTTTTDRPSLDDADELELGTTESQLSRESSIEHARISHAETRTVRLGGGDLETVVTLVERKPSLTRIVGGKVAGAAAPSDREGARRRHESVAGLIGGTPEPTGDDSEPGPTSQSRLRGERFTRRQDPELPSEEDRPDYWVKRGFVPKYTVAEGDPRRTAAQ